MKSSIPAHAQAPFPLHPESYSYSYSYSSPYPPTTSWEALGVPQFPAPCFRAVERM